MKKLLTLFIIFTMSLSGMVSFAEVQSSTILNPNFNAIEVENGIIEPMAVLTCPYYGIHQMKATGRWANIYYNGQCLERAYGEYECKCGEIIVCQGSPQYAGNPLGYYFTGERLYNRQIAGYNVSYTSTVRYPFYTADSYLEGYTFLAY